MSRLLKGSNQRKSWRKKSLNLKKQFMRKKSLNLKKQFMRKVSKVKEGIRGKIANVGNTISCKK